MERKYIGCEESEVWIKYNGVLFRSLFSFKEMEIDFNRGNTISKTFLHLMLVIFFQGKKNFRMENQGANKLS